jgi:hypothetical protein
MLFVMKLLLDLQLVSTNPSLLIFLILWMWMTNLQPLSHLRGRLPPSVFPEVDRVIKTSGLLKDTEFYTYIDAVGDAILCFATVTFSTGTELVEPLTYDQALKSKQAIDWKKALNSEFGSLIANKTWNLVDCPR